MTDKRFLPEGYHAIAPGKLANVVTFLEMTARPDRPARPTPAGYTLTEIDHWDNEAFLRLYKAIGWEWLWTSRLLMSETELTARLARPGNRSFCPTKDGQRMGVLEMDFADPTNVEISFFGLVPEAIGGGIGGWLMDQAIALAFDRPETKRLWLHTCHFDSPQALPFYQRMGFRPYARAVEVHDDPRLLGRLDPAAGPHVPLIADARWPDGL
ncbi:GNAT family N-acetyltransferase [Oryzibacter oryziterrae]|uniref:GNAT family N-acetyltransferase n=1 Tax=Oryzibacter oryziterrae TaxID=2766474 RepID=UPI001F487B3F|nr:GNAT family N-acetyltransferase [Oryzibacter oryziterrae]